jgi:type II secretory pathway predicted ATPase ExeA
VYNSYFGFSESPFLNNYKYSFLFLSNQSEEVLSNLIDFIKQANGSAVLYGDQGYGKTMLLKCLVRRLPKSVQPIMANSLAGPMEIMHDIAKALNITMPGSGVFDLSAVEKALIEGSRQKKYFLLIVDDAHLLDEKTLDTIWLFSNIERDDKNLLKILLVGQPELNDKLKRLEMKHLPQFVTLERHLSHLNAVDTIKYVSHRLRKVGSGISACFEPNCMDMIYELTGGVPQRINQVCDAALTACVELNLKKVNRKILKKLGHSRRQQAAFAHSTHGFGKPWLPVIMSLVIIIIISLWGVKRLSPTKLNQTAPPAVPAPTGLNEAQPAPAPAVSQGQKTAGPQAAAAQEPDSAVTVSPALPQTPPKPSPAVSGPTATNPMTASPVTASAVASPAAPAPAAANATAASSAGAPPTAPPSAAAPPATPEEPAKSNEAASQPQSVRQSQPVNQDAPAPEVGNVQDESGVPGPGATVYTVSPQDKNLTSIVANHYLGNKKIGVEAVILANPSLTSENLIHPSERILLPRVDPDRSLIVLDDNLFYMPYGRYQPSPLLQQDLDRFKKLQVRYALRKTEDSANRVLYWIFLGGYEKEAQLIEARRTLARR